MIFSYVSPFINLSRFLAKSLLYKMSSSLFEMSILSTGKKIDSRYKLNKYLSLSV